MVLSIDRVDEAVAQNGTPAGALPDGLGRFEAFATFFDLRTGAIGRAVGSEREPAGSHVFFIWADESARTLDVGHIVITTSEDALVIGVVDEPRRFSDLRTFLDDFFDRSLELALESELPTRRPEILVFKVNVLATRHLRDDVDSHRPPVGGPVYFASKTAIEYALDRQGFTGTPIPALLHTNGNAERDNLGNERLDEAGNLVFQQTPIWLDEDYLLGPEAGHANWTGQSGLATKTSHALFLTSAVFQTMRAEGKSVAALMFNVKSADLLWLDKPAVPEPGMEEAYAEADCPALTREDLDAYSALGMHAHPFKHFRIFAPFRPELEPHGLVANLADLKKYHADLNTSRNSPNEVHCVYPILLQLKPLLSLPHKIFEYSDLDDKLFGLIDDLRARGVETLIELKQLFAEIANDLEENGGDTWQGHHKFTIRKAQNRFNNLASKFGGLIAEGAVKHDNMPWFDHQFEDHELRVIDIAKCNTNVQELLVTRVITAVWRMAEEQKLGVEKVIVFVDELNKYAPGGSQSALRDTLVDIAARGRHLNVVLFGAQQFRSKVDDEILGNCGTSFYGRVGDEEIINASYRSLSDTTKAELLGLRKGRLLVRHAHFRAPLFGSFPKPPTITGVGGQKVFNSGTNAGDTHDGDGLFQLLQRLAPNDFPSKSDVRTATDGFPRDFLQQLCRQVEHDHLKYKDTTSGNRIKLWARAQAKLRDNYYLRRP